MKKAILILLYCLLANATILFSQHSKRKDSATIAKEMEQVNRMIDSMRPILAARDSESKAKWEEISRNSSRILEDQKQKELEWATKEVMKRQEKEQQRKRNTMLMAGAAFVITIAVIGTIRRRKKNKE